MTAPYEAFKRCDVPRSKLARNANHVLHAFYVLLHPVRVRGRRGAKRTSYQNIDPSWFGMFAHL